MSLTDVLAVVGAVTGTTSALAQVVVIRRDRPRLALDMGFTTAVGERPNSYVEVFNIGPRATTVREVGYYGKRVQVQIGEGETALEADAELTYKVNDAPFFLEAGEHRRFWGPPGSVDDGLHADFPLRIYALDVRGRRVWGSAGPVARWLVGDDPPLTGQEPEGFSHLLRPASEPLLPERVEPRWKFWKPRELRNPNAYRADKRPPRRLRS